MKTVVDQTSAKDASDADARLQTSPTAISIEVAGRDFVVVDLFDDICDVRNRWQRLLCHRSRSSLAI
ncbi:hypothetical protein [Brevibacterium iodinum]|uniref:hypothetical protein n=1 Tax=Brevibacterium iodinum TaxID=31943 RepID=UPI0011AF1DD3|nr:hypothetical protein [Brevibacterium iodinum]